MQGYCRLFILFLVVLTAATNQSRAEDRLVITGDLPLQGATTSAFDTTLRNNLERSTVAMPGTSQHMLPLTYTNGRKQCLFIDNAGAQTFYVPLSTFTEFQAFVNNHPADAAIVYGCEAETVPDTCYTSDQALPQSRHLGTAAFRVGHSREVSYRCEAWAPGCGTWVKVSETGACERRPDDPIDDPETASGCTADPLLCRAYEIALATTPDVSSVAGQHAWINQKKQEGWSDEQIVGGLVSHIFYVVENYQIAPPWGGSTDLTFCLGNVACSSVMTGDAAATYIAQFDASLGTLHRALTPTEQEAFRNAVLEGQRLGMTSQEALLAAARAAQLYASGTCLPSTATSNATCPAGYTGTYTYTTNHICDGSNGGLGRNEFVVTDNRCIVPCTPSTSYADAACPSGYVGTYTYSTTRVCDGSNNGAGRNDVAVTNNRCVVASTCTPSTTYGDTTCPSGYTGTYSYSATHLCDGSNGGAGRDEYGVTSNRCTAAS